MLSLMTYLPLAGAVLILLAPKNNDIIRGIALVTTFANFIVSLIITIGFDRSLTGYQFTEKADWIPGLGATYHMGVDGVSVLMLLLDGILFFLAIIASWKPIQTRIREYYFSMLLLNVGLVGVFCALDFFLFYIFWELVLIPMAVLIGVWGGPRRIYAAVKFFLYTLVGSLLMLVAIIALYFEYVKVTGKAATLDIVEITDGLAKAGGLNHDFQFWAFLAFGVAFCIKIPMWPLHTWLPDAHTEAPTAGSVILAGVMLKMGGYGLIRFNLSLFPNASHDLAPFMIVLALIAIIYGALVALVQPDMKRLVAYSSVSHMGFVVLGLFSFASGFGETVAKGEVNPLLHNRQGFDGAVFTMFSHGLLTSGLFLCVGVIYDRLHTRDINTISNTLRIGNRMPLYATIMMVYTMGSLGLPMLSGFVGEFLSMQGAFRVTGWYAFTASFVIVFAAVYMLWLYKRVLFGRVDDYDLAFVEGKIKEAEEYERSHGGHASHNAEHSHEEHSHAAHAHEEHGHGHGHADKDMLRNGAKLKDLNFAEWFTLYPMAAFSIVTGVFPVLVLDFLGKPAEAITNVASKSVDIAGSIDYAAIVHLFSK
jgi:NADH-quinone oxidoreductase subunit M